MSLRRKWAEKNKAAFAALFLGVPRTPLGIVLYTVKIYKSYT